VLDRGPLGDRRTFDRVSGSTSHMALLAILQLVRVGLADYASTSVLVAQGANVELWSGRAWSYCR
jgi:hypothetical protein